MKIWHDKACWHDNIDMDDMPSSFPKLTFPWRNERGPLNLISRDCKCDQESARDMIKMEQNKLSKLNLANGELASPSDPKNQ